MTLEADLDELQARGIVFFIEGRTLRFRAPKGGLTDADRKWLGERRDAVIELLRARAERQSEHLALSAGQQSMWMVNQLSPGGPVTNLASAVRIGTAADPELSRETLQFLIDRHAMLRTTFHLDDEGELYQQVAGSAPAIVDMHDAQGLAEDELRRLVDAERDRPLDLERGPPVRLSVFRLSDSEHLVLLVAHHIVSDGGSLIMLMYELISVWSALHRGTPVELPALRATYADHVREQAALLAGEQGEALWSYWHDQLHDAPTEVPLVFDHVRGTTAGFRGDSVVLAMEANLVEDLTRLGKETGVTNFTLFLTLYQLFLARFTGTTDIVIGSSFSDRPAESAGVIGDYINALPVRARLRWSMTMREALVQQRSVVHDAIDAQAYPVQRLIERLRPERAGGASPLFNCYFNFGNLPMIQDFATLLAGFGDGLIHDGIALMPFGLVQQSGQFDLTLSLAQSETRVVGRIDFPADRFERASIERLAAEFLGFLEQCAADPDDALFARQDRHRVLEGFNQSASPIDCGPFVTQLLERLPAYADRTAIRFGAETLDYAGLLRAAHGLAARLRAAGAERGVVVGIWMDRTPAMLAALLAVQQAGAAYLPLDPAYPADRLGFMMADSGLSLLVSDRDKPEWAPADVTVITPQPADDRTDPNEVLADGPTSDDLAYILYTSGSTGRPNGVRITHGALSNFLGAMVVEPGIRETDVFAAITTISFDIAALELFGPLLVGATIDLLPREIAGDGAAIAARCADAGATMLQATPTLWRQLIDADWQPAPGFTALSGGEPLPGDLAAALLARGVTLWNLYGPTETTIHSMASHVLDPTSIDVGHPVANTRIYVLDHREPVPVDVEGDIWIAGAGLAQGYHDRPELTAERFQPDPFSDEPGARMYRTGDRGRWRADGTLVHLGRSDDQIKLRGFRVEPAEIEAALAGRDDVLRAVVVPRPSGDDVRLVAFVVPSPGHAPTSQELRRHLRQQLPEYMVPAMFVDVPEIPVTPNGKIDRRSLPNPFAGAAPDRAQGALHGDAEHRLAEIWQDVLNLERVGPGDNFFELGGHSLLAVKVATMLRRKAGYEVPPELLFFHTLRDIAATLKEPGAPKLGLSQLRPAWLNRRRSANA